MDKFWTVTSEGGEVHLFSRGADAKAFSMKSHGSRLSLFPVTVDFYAPTVKEETVKEETVKEGPVKVGDHLKVMLSFVESGVYFAMHDILKVTVVSEAGMSVRFCAKPNIERFITIHRFYNGTLVPTLEGKVYTLTKPLKILGGISTYSPGMMLTVVREAGKTVDVTCDKVGRYFVNKDDLFAACEPLPGITVPTANGDIIVSGEVTFQDWHIRSGHLIVYTTPFKVATFCLRRISEGETVWSNGIRAVRSRTPKPWTKDDVAGVPYVLTKNKDGDQHIGLTRFIREYHFGDRKFDWMFRQRLWSMSLAGPWRPCDSDNPPPKGVASCDV